VRIPTTPSSGYTPTETGTEVEVAGGIITFSPEIELTEAQVEAFRAAFNQIVGARVETPAPGPAVQIISDADIYPGILADEKRHNELLTWLRANGIEPNVIPADSTVSIEPDVGGHVIRHAVYLKGDGGRYYVADPDDLNKGAATEERAVPLTVPLPDSWPQPVQRAEPTKES
jgi:hypothetical protein